MSFVSLSGFFFIYGSLETCLTISVFQILIFEYVFLSCHRTVTFFTGVSLFSYHMSCLCFDPCHNVCIQIFEGCNFCIFHGCLAICRFVIL